MSALPADLRLANRARVLSWLRRGPSSKAALAAATKLSRPTAGAIVDSLLAEGLLISTGMRESGHGRPGQLVQLDASRPAFAILHLDGEQLRSGLLALAPPIDEPAVWLYEDPLPRNLDHLSGIAGTLTANRPELRALALSISGVLDTTQGRLMFSHRLPWAVGIDIEAELSKRLGLPVVLVQEIHALALGYAAAHPETEHFLLIDSGAGVGAAACSQGRVLSGLGGMTGEIGHGPVPGNQRRCGCGGTGCLETLFRRECLASVSDEELGLGATIIAAAVNAWGAENLVLSGAFSELPERRWTILEAAIRSSTLSGRQQRLHISPSAAPRALGLHHYLSQRFIDYPSPQATP